MLIQQLYNIFLQHPVICTDTRDIKPGSIFFALKGNKFNANEFAAQALEKGSAYMVIDEEKFKKDDQYILVADVLTSLQQLANYHRKQLAIPFIGITGSNGKTTTKELIAAVLGKKFNVAFTKGNLNNHIGVPLTLLGITKQHEIAVIEMGANHVGEIKQLCEIAEPDHGIITNIGRAHLEGFGGPEGVIKAKNELYQFIHQTNGKLFVNYDNELLRDLSAKTDHITYGTINGTDVQGELTIGHPYVQLKWKHKSDHLSLDVKDEIKTQLAGAYNFENILAAACIGNFFGVTEKQIKEAIEEYAPTNSRSQIIKKGSNTIIMDAYNANPTSMKAALENFAFINSKNKVMILGDMLELGADSAAEHQQIVDLIKNNKGLYNAKTILVGKHFTSVNNSIGAELLTSSAEAVQWLKQHSVQESVILIKGSRGTKLEVMLEVIS